MRFRVADSGIGIAVDRQQRIFLPFTQVDASTTRKYGGTGLGLSICRLIAQHLSGTLEVQSCPGEGSIFTFWVPIVPVAAASASAASDDRVTSPVDVAGLRVLLAEDDATNRMVAIRMLARLGASAVVARDGEEAVAAVAQAEFDLVLMDVHMPRMDGIAATKEIGAFSTRTGRPRPRIVAVTANALSGDSDRLLAAGMDGYLAKPITLKALSSVLTAVATGDALPRGHDRRSTDRQALPATQPNHDHRVTR